MTSQPSRTRRYIAFSAAGFAGFAVDAGVLALGLTLGLGATAARVPSFLAAALTTWSVNRRVTFEVARPATLREFLGYLSAMSFALAVNLGVYVAALSYGLRPLAALLLGTSFGAVLNYWGARRILDRRRAERAAQAARGDSRRTPSGQRSEIAQRAQSGPL